MLNHLSGMKMKKKLIMIKSIKKILLLSALCLLPLFLKGQDRIQAGITEKFINYCHNVPWEEVYIHTDRDEYIAGEIIWFSARIIDRLSMKPSALSRIVYLEVLNSENKPVVQKKVKVERGTGAGMALLPDTLSSGDYIIRARTRYMKNFFPHNCFTRQISVFNAINVSPVKRRAYINNPFRKETDNFSYETSAEKTRPVNIVNNADSLIILVKSHETETGQREKYCYMFIQTHGVIDVNEKINISAGITRLAIPKNSLTKGINHLTLFDTRGRPFSETYLLNRSSGKNILKMTAQTDARPGSKNVVDITLEQDVLSSLSGQTLSIAVIPEPFKNEDNDIASYLVFGSEFGFIPGHIRKELSEGSENMFIDDFLRNAGSKWLVWDKILSDSLPEIKYIPENENHYISGKLVNRGTLAPVHNEIVFISFPGEKTEFMYSRTAKDGSFIFPLPLKNSNAEIIIKPENTDQENIIDMESPFKEPFYQYFDSVIFDTKIPEHVSRMSINYQLNNIFRISLAERPVNNLDTLTVSKNFYGIPDIKIIMDDYIRLPVMEEVVFELLPGVTMKRTDSGFEMFILDPVYKRAYNSPPGIFIDGVILNDATVLANLNPESVEQIEVVLDKYMVGEYLFNGIVNVLTKKCDLSDVTLPGNSVKLSYRVTDPVDDFLLSDDNTQELQDSRDPDLRNTIYWDPAVKPDAEGKIVIEFRNPDYVTDYIVNIQGLTNDGEALSYRAVVEVEE